MAPKDENKLIKAIKEGRNITISSDIMTFCNASEVIFNIEWEDYKEAVPYLRLDELVDVAPLESEAEEYLNKLREFHSK